MNNIKHHSLDAHVRIKSTELLKFMYKTKKPSLFQKLNYLYWYLTVFNLHLTFKVMEVCRPLEAATLTALHINTCPS